MEEEDLGGVFLPPVHTNTFGIPQEHDLLLAYDVYKPSNATRRLQSEAGRRIYAEAFIEQPQLGTLSDLCVRTLAKERGPLGLLPLVAEEALKLRVHYDALPVDVPLAECYQVSDESFWRRVVLAKSDDKSLAFRRDYDWRRHGISLKLSALLEDCAAEFWDEQQMTTLALQVKDYVTHLHIRRLKSLQERSFERYLDSDAEENELDGDDDSSEMDTVSETDEEEEDPVPEEAAEPVGDEPQEDDNGGGGGGGGGDADNVDRPTPSQLELARFEAEQRAAIRLELHDDRERRRKLRAEKQIRRARRAAKRLAAIDAELAALLPTKKKKTKIVKSVFDIELSDDEEDVRAAEEQHILDRRNLDKFLRRKRKYEYPAEHCHHIDLSYLRHFDGLTSFTLEFLGPLQDRDYHVRHMNFSYDDIERLANGLSSLQRLQIFRLRNSRMDTRKLNVLARKLRFLPQLHTLDFGYDQLQDDCDESLALLLRGSTALCSLELEGNNLGFNAMRRLGEALAAYAGELRYLGLAGNLLGDAALHALVSCILGGVQVQQLNLRGVRLSEAGVICCIANELLRAHGVLRQLDLVGVPIGWTAGVELAKALDTNQTILQLNCRGCNLPLDVEFDVEVMLRRNRFIAENPFVGDDSKTEEEIDAWVNRTKNTILLDALAAVQRRADCLAARPDVPLPLTAPPSQLSQLNSANSLDIRVPTKQSVRHSTGDGSSVSCALPFVYDTQQFDEEEFMRHVLVPGPGERFQYFQEMKQLHHR